ncbi:hypothetical protein, partial [Escherichia coli]|uniref:hypothetical protein n=1 Tax=Escherichia coli TaxID=562 RepID=UPI003F674068
GFLHPQNIRRPPERAVRNETLFRKKLPTKEQSNRVSVFHSVYSVDDSDIPAITGLDNWKDI